MGETQTDPSRRLYDGVYPQTRTFAELLIDCEEHRRPDHAARQIAVRTRNDLASLAQ